MAQTVAGFAPPMAKPASKMPAQKTDASARPRMLRTHAAAGRNEAAAIFQPSDRTNASRDGDAWMLIEGDDVMSPQVAERHKAWLQTFELAGRSTLAFTDP